MFEPRSEVPATGRDRWIAAGIFAVVFGFFLADLLENFEPAKLSIPFMLLAWAPLLALHEFGHALAARQLGWRLDGIVIGFGPRIAEWRVGGVPIEVRSLPVEGFVLCRPLELSGVRWKSTFIYFAGPGIELMLALLLLVGVGPEVLLARSEEIQIIALQSVALAATMGGVLNLMPHSTWKGDEEIVSDGLGIVQTLLRPLSEWERELLRRELLGLDDEVRELDAGGEDR